MLRLAGQSLVPSEVPPIQEACLAPPYVSSNTCVPQQCLFSAHSCIIQKCGEASAKGLNKGLGKNRGRSRSLRNCGKTESRVSGARQHALPWQPPPPAAPESCLGPREIMSQFY